MVTTRKSSILGPDGRPAEIMVLDGEIAEPTDYGIRRVIEDKQATGMTPQRLARVLRNAETGLGRDYLTLAFEMEERYLHYAGQLQTRRLAIEGIAPTVSAKKSVPSKIVDAVNDLIDDNGFAAMAGDLTDGISKGYAAVEMAWEYEAGHLKPVAYKFRDPRFFVFDRKSLSELRLATDTSPFDGEELPPYAFLRHFPRTRMGIPLRRGLARPAAWAFLIQSFSLTDWASFAEIYGVPLRLGRYGPNASDKDKRALLQAVKAISNDGAAIAPSGMEIEFHKVEGQHGTAVFGGLIDYVDRQVSKLVVGQTMTSDNGSSLAQAQIHNEVRLDILRADCNQLAATINRDLIEPFVAFNFGPQDNYPIVEFPVPEPEDIDTLTNAVSRLVPLGLKVGQRAMREKLALPDPSEDDELLGSPAVATPPPQTKPDTESRAAKLHVTGCPCDGCLARLSAAPAGPEADEIDRIKADELADWEDITDPLLSPLQAILEKASTLEEARTMLAAARLDSSALVEALARCTAKARGLGDIGDDLPGED
jgi:phage gp29-like protein